LTTFGILLILASALLHSSWNFFTKKGNWPLEFFFWVFLWGIFLYLPFSLIAGAFPGFLLHLPLKLWGIATTSGILETIYFICLVEGYRRGDLSFIYPISRSAPLFTQMWAFLFIAEVLSTQGIVGIGLVVIGLFTVSLKDFRLGNLLSPSQRFTSLPYLLALGAAVASSIYSVFDKVGVQLLHPVFYIWIVNFWMCVFTGLYLVLSRADSFWKVWRESKKEILTITILQNMAYLLVLMAMQSSKVSYVVAFRQVGAVFGAGMGILLLKESYWKTRITGALILTLGLVLIALAR
jgi:uncharacterized membrane protein